jgi:hypothetical protein
VHVFAIEDDHLVGTVPSHATIERAIRVEVANKTQHYYLYLVQVVKSKAQDVLLSNLPDVHCNYTILIITEFSTASYASSCIFPISRIVIWTLLATSKSCFKETPREVNAVRNSEHCESTRECHGSNNLNGVKHGIGLMHDLTCAR